LFDDTAPIVPAVWDAASAQAARSAGARALFLSGSALAATFGFPDIGLVPPEDLVRTTRLISEASELELLVDTECGFGSVADLALHARALGDAGATAILLEDQEFTGQSVAATGAGLCEPSVMVERIQAAKDATRGRLGVLARTDVVGPDWRFEESLSRLALYRDAGADWLTAVFVRSRAELVLAAELAADRLVAVAVPAVTGYVPEPREASSSGCAGVIVTGFLQAAFRELRGLYELVLAGDTAALRQRQPSRDEFAVNMRFERFDRRANGT
jgi:2-methylisocitrate lyase-like PEP mutase family enzyme